MLRPAFFAVVSDDARVTLTVHFCSGAGVTFYVTTSGGAV